jgi:NADPH2:quinone reductase
MKAIVCSRIGPPESLTVEDLPSPVPAAGEILVGVKAAGVNFPDALVIQGKYQHSQSLPFTPGKEVAGVVLGCGEGVTGYQPGDRVCAYLSHGAFASEITVKADYAVAHLPAGVDFVEAAAFPLVYSTSMHVLADRGQLQPGETLLVLGASGGVGIAAVQLGKLLGARVIACASSQEKLDFCRRHGADELINYEQEDLREAINRLTDKRGVDVVCDPVGGRYAEPAVRGMAWNGRYCVVGFAAGDIPKIPANLMLLKGCAVLGCAFGSFARRDSRPFSANLARMLAWMGEGRLKPVVTATYPLERTPAALRDMLDRKVTGKVVITF